MNTTIVTLNEILAEDPECATEDHQLSCDDIASSLSTHMKGIDKDKEPDRHRVWQLVYSMCFMHFKPSDRVEPFGPMAVFGDKRSAIPSDFRGEQTDVLAAWAPSIKNLALRARIADIAWVNNRRNALCGRLAVQSYLECIDLLLAGAGKLRFDRDDAWDPGGISMLERALTLAYALGHDKAEASNSRAAVEKVGWRRNRTISHMAISAHLN